MMGFHDVQVSFPLEEFGSKAIEVNDLHGFPFCLHLRFGVCFLPSARCPTWSRIIQSLTGGWFIRGSIIWKPFIFGGGSGVADPLMGDEDGNYATNEAWPYDFIIRQWALWASMLVLQVQSTCCVLDIKITVISGSISHRKSFSQAETRDPKKNAWI